MLTSLQTSGRSGFFFEEEEEENGLLNFNTLCIKGGGRQCRVPPDRRLTELPPLHVCEGRCVFVCEGCASVMKSKMKTKAESQSEELPPPSAPSVWSADVLLHATVC